MSIKMFKSSFFPVSQVNSRWLRGSKHTRSATHGSEEKPKQRGEKRWWKDFDIALKFSFSDIRMPGMGSAVGFAPIKNMVTTI